MTKLVYKQYDQEALNRQYNNRLQVPGFAAYFNHWEKASYGTVVKYSPFKNIAYGKLERERLDIYPSAKPRSKTLIFIHGGYWHKLDKELFHFIAAAFYPYDITTVFINYPLAPESSMDQIVFSCRQAIHWVYKNIAQYNGDPAEIYLAGHSAGGHLATMLMTAGSSDFSFPADTIKGVCVISGLYNLLPIQLSELNDVLKMDNETVMRNSPVNLSPAIHCPLLVATGEDESDEFKDQAKEMYDWWKKQGVPVQLIGLPGINHYSIADALADTASALHREMLRMMGMESLFL